jgi:hypothetical protein
MPIGLKGNTDGSGAVQIGGSDAITISTGLNTTFAGTVTASGGVLYPLTSGTAIASTSGTALDFTGIPSTAKRITVSFAGVSLNGSSSILVQLGSGSVTTSGYTGLSNGNSGAGSASVSSSAGFPLYVAAAGNAIAGHMILTLITSNIWVASHAGGTGASNVISVGGGSSSSLSGVLDRVRVTTINGTDTFDAGLINLLWE